MKDSYSFDSDADGLDTSYQKHYDAYRRIFDRCGLKYAVVEAHSGSMGGSQSHEFMVMTDAGEDMVASCAACGYAANLEKASSKLPAAQELPGAHKPEEIATPGMKTIADLTRFRNSPQANTIKTLPLLQIDVNRKHPAQKH